MTNRFVRIVLDRAASLASLLIALALLIAAGFIAAARSHLPSVNFYGLGPGTTIALLLVIGLGLGLVGLIQRLLGRGPGVEDDGIQPAAAQKRERR